jgi:hypothetical protein
VSYLLKRAGKLMLAASMLVGGLLPLAASPAAAVTDPLAGSAGPTLLYPHMPTDSDQPVPPPGMTVSEFLRHPVLSWQPITKVPVTRYRVELSPNADWTNDQVTLPDSGLTTVTQYELPTTLPQASYFWRVRGEDATGHHTAWSGAMSDTSDWHFRRGWDDYPALVHGNLADGSVDMAWQPIADASTYELQMSDNPGFVSGAGVMVDCFTNHTRFTLVDDASTAVEGACNVGSLVTDIAANPGKTYYWQVRGIDQTTAAAVPTEVATTCETDGADCSAWSSIGTFTAPTVTGTPSGLATNLSVSCTATLAGGSGEPLCADTPTMSWDAVPGADSYLVDVSVTPTFTTMYRSYAVHYGHTLTPRDSYLDNQAGKSYYWRVRACVVDGNLFGCTSTGPDAPMSTFHKRSLPLPLAPQSAASSTAGHDGLFATVDNGETFAARTNQVRSNQLTLHWDDYLDYLTQSGAGSTQDAKNYEVAYADNADFDNATTVYVDAPRWTPSPTLPDGSYYWKVEPIDGSGNHLTWSDTATFVKGTVPAVARIAASGYLTPTQQVEVDFSAPVSGVSTSTLGVYDVLTGRQLVGSVRTAGADTAYFTPAAPLIPGQRLRVWTTSAVKDLAGNVVTDSVAQVRVNPTVDSTATANLTQGWATKVDSHASGGSYARSSSAGDKLSFRVAGTSFTLVGAKMSNGGYADVSVDGVLKATVSFYGSSTRWQQSLLSGQMASGTHVVTVTVRGTHVSGSHGSFVYVDALKVGSSTVQQNGRLATQTWATHRATDAFGGSFLGETGYVSGTASVAPTVSVRVEGGRLKMYGCKSPDSGLVGVYVDGSYKGRVDLYQSYSSCNVLVYSVALSSGAHHVGFRASGVHRTGATGTRVAIDRFVVSDS